MNEDKTAQDRPSRRRFDVLVEWLGVKDPEKNREAITLLCRVGKLARELLVQEAIKPGKRSQHRIAILDVVEKIGGPLGMDEMFSLQSLLRHRDLGVRQKAERVIMAVSPCGLPDSPEAAALMRAFNPFLQPLPQHRPRKKRSSQFGDFYRGAVAAARRLAKSKKARQRRSA